MRPISGGETIEPIVPGLEGGTNWFPMAYNPELGYVFFATNHWAMALTAWKPEDVVYKAGEPYMGVDYQMYRLEDDIGYVKAFDVANKEFVWETPSPLPCSPACSRPRAASCSPATSWATSMALDARTGEPCGSSRPAPGSTPRRSPTSSTAPSTSRSSRAWAAIRASTSRAQGRHALGVRAREPGPRRRAA